MSGHGFTSPLVLYGLIGLYGILAEWGLIVTRRPAIVGLNRAYAIMAKSAGNQMIAYKRTVTIQNPRQLVLDDLPFRPGQQVEVVILADEERQHAPFAELQALFRETQALPQARTITDEEIAAEIEAYRMAQHEGTD